MPLATIKGWEHQEANGARWRILQPFGGGIVLGVAYNRPPCRILPGIITNHSFPDGLGLEEQEYWWLGCHTSLPLASTL